MKVKLTKDIEECYDLYQIAYNNKDHNYKNYHKHQFETDWADSATFVTLRDNNKLVAFCSIKVYNEVYARIFNRYYISNQYRKKGLMHAEYSLLMFPKILMYCQREAYVPFFSIQGAGKKKQAIKIAIKKFNKYLEMNYFKLLDDLYWTCDKEEPHDNDNCWQNIAIKINRELNLPRREIWLKHKL